MQISGATQAAGGVKYKGNTVASAITLGIVNCGASIYKSYGIRGLMQGYSGTFARSVPSFGICYLVYEYIVNKAQRHGYDKSGPVMLLAGCMYC